MAHAFDPRKIGRVIEPYYRGFSDRTQAYNSTDRVVIPICIYISRFSIRTRLTYGYAAPAYCDQAGLLVMSAESILFSVVTSDLTNIRNIADEIPADPKIMHITMI